MEIGMGEILQSLKTSAVKRQKHLSPIQHRRNKLLASIHLQLEAAKAKQDGKRYSIKRQRRITNPLTGESIDTVKDVAVREAWWLADDGRLYLEVRYGYKPLELAKGKTSIEVGDWSNLIPTLEKLRMATEMGEFDGQLTDAFSRLAEQLKARRKK
jgi:hypothetical protein